MGAPAEVPVAAGPAGAPAPERVPGRGYRWIEARRARLRQVPAWAVVLAVAALAGAAVLSAHSIDSDSGQDLLGLGRAVLVDTSRLRWQYTAVVIALAGAHYLATAVAARASSGLPLRYGEITLVQLAAAAANRLTPGGLGGAALNARYFTRRGLDAPQAVGAVTVLAVLGMVADLGVLGIVLLLGQWLGLNGSVHELGVLGSRVAGLLRPLGSVWVWLAAVVAGALIVTLLRRTNWALGDVWIPVRRLARRPGSLAQLLVASGCTTLVLGFAFIATTAMVPGAQPQVRLGALLVAFMVGAAAGTSVPVPAGLGSTEVVLVAVLVSTHVPAVHAVQEVLIFRILTFWAPAVVGVLATRRLRRLDAL